MLVLSKLTNINHANGGSYDPPLFLYSALFAARGRFDGASPHGGELWRGFPARRRAFAGLPRPAAGFGGLPRTAAGFGWASPHGGGLWRVAPPGGGLWWVAPHGGGLWRASPPGGGLWRGFPARRRTLAGLPRTAANFCGASPHGGGLWRGFPARRALAGCPARLSLPPRYIRLGAGSFFAVFRIRARHTAKASAKISPVTLPYFILRRKIQEVC